MAMEQPQPINYDERIRTQVPQGELFRQYEPFQNLEALVEVPFVGPRVSN